MKSKMKLEDLNVKSFATSIDNQDDVKGGATPTITTLTTTTVTTITTITTTNTDINCPDPDELTTGGISLTGGLRTIFNC